ncbi:toxin-antitoxin system HicB family antitoxin [Streptomyces sp. HUAS TT20]|uniref:toxin-antitoxin system HicB family antitoxin n=1 Tax=Streptomyces sp. HUAS TT20 TaxID=3447509 RepID=UPI0021DB6869|nr:toxin-antitoxin system HicB family antitoxin [Streptomyces sp. HUAS 15-9]UXY29366.1 toxin-antitoxin system HicB family antitoxin [Streptomyces sp. HUAS 15-9]
MIKLNLRLPEDLYAQAKVAAAADDRSLNSWLVAVVRRAVFLEEMPKRPARDPADTDRPDDCADSTRL